MSERSPRKPRFARVCDAPNFRLTPRDREIIRHVRRYRFLRSSHIAALIDASQQVTSRRLQLLFHHGYLDRPREQLALMRLHGSDRIVYAIPGKRARYMFMEHTLSVADFMVSLECECRARAGTRFIEQEEIISKAPESTRTLRNPLSWTVTIQNRGKRVRIGVVPDRVFGIEIKNAEGKVRVGYFFLEADRGTMPITRRSLAQTSIERKIAAYRETWEQRLHEKNFGLLRFRVLFVCESTPRRERIRRECTENPNPHLLLTTGKASATSMTSIFDGV